MESGENVNKQTTAVTHSYWETHTHKKKINGERKGKRMGTWGKDAGKRTGEERGRGGQR